jgi:hypothetical protein
MMFGMKLLSKLFLEDKPHPKGDELYGCYEGLLVAEEASDSEPPKKDIGEPVLSLAKSILETEDWELRHDLTPYPGMNWFSLVKGNLTVAFKTSGEVKFTDRVVGVVRTTITTCLASWMTQDEQVYMAEVFREWQRLEEKRAEERRISANVATRERFMRELVDHRGQLELELN